MIKVLVVDDSALIRKLLTDILSQDPEIEVVGTASDPYIAREKIKQLNPDVITLDVEMPKMDGLTFLSNLMRLRPMPVVMISTLTEMGASITLEALELGALDFVSKPKVDVEQGLEAYAEAIVEKVKMAARANVSKNAGRLTDAAKIQVTPKFSADAVLAKQGGRGLVKTTDKIFAIGSSTGGTEAVRQVVSALPANFPGIVIAQHIPGAFSGPFANRVDSVSAMNVMEAQDGQQIQVGHVYIAPGDKHLIVERSGGHYVCRLNDGPPVNRHKPSVDVLFRSVAQAAGPNAFGLMLTGMGADGAAGMLEMKQAGALNIAQDEATSVVWGMPGEAVKRGAVDEVLPLGKIAGRLVQLAGKA